MNIVQIGANRGNDDLTDIIGQTQLNKFVIVEPLSVHNEYIEKCYEWVNNKIIENVAIVTENIDNIEFYYHINDGPEYLVASTNEMHILNHGYKSNGIVKLIVPAYTINNLLQKHKIFELDILFIDAEGLDDAIIRSIDFDQYKINKIYFENLHLKSDVNSFLNDKGYSITKNIGNNGWMHLATIN